MIDDHDLTRRRLLKRSLVVLSATVAAPWISACGSDGDSFTCTDTSGLDSTQVQTRQSLAYVDQTPIPEKTCLNCQLWQSGNETSECGRCQVVPGPIHPNGYCNSWAEKQS